MPRSPPRSQAGSPAPAASAGIRPARSRSPGPTTYTGGTTVAAGRLVGSVASLPGDITNNATVEFAESGAAAYTGVVSGSGGFVKSGAGSLALAGGNAYTGASSIAGGTLVVGNGATAGTLGGTGSIANAGVLAFNRSDSVILGRAVSGSGSLVQQGSGTLVLTADNTHAGGTTVSAGTLQVGNGGATGSFGNGPVSVASGATLAFDRSDELSVASVISGDGSVVKNGSNTLNFSAGNAYSGGTVINSGTVVAASSTALGTGGVTLSGGTLRLANAVTMANDIALSGTRCGQHDQRAVQRRVSRGRRRWRRGGPRHRWRRWPAAACSLEASISPPPRRRSPLAAAVPAASTCKAVRRAAHLPSGP